MSDLPIGEHGFLSDCHSAALVSRAGSVDLLCLPRFDTSSVSARLLDDAAGPWRIAAPARPASGHVPDEMWQAGLDAGWNGTESPRPQCTSR